MANVTAWRNRIFVRFNVHGKRPGTTIDARPTTTTLKAIKRQARDWEWRLRNGEPWESVRADIRGETYTTPRTLGYYFQHVLNTAEVEETTSEKYAQCYNRYWLDLDERDIASLTKTELEAHLNTFDVGRKTRKNVVSVLRRAFEAAKDDQYITTAPTDRWRIKAGQRPAKDPYSASERDAVLAQLEGVAQAYFSVAFFSGLRTQELLALQPRHLRRPHLRIEQVMARRRIYQRTKTDTARDAHLAEHVWPMLEPYRFQAFVFENEWGRPFTQANPLMAEWRAAHDAAGVRLRTGKYPWRSTYISLALRAGVPPGVVARHTGHDQATMWRAYAEFIPGDRDAEILDAAFRSEK